MNERIQELIRTKSTILFPGTDVVDCNITDIEKFAQLIVQECANKIAESFIPEDELIEDYKKDWDNTMRFAADSIKQHFGVSK